LGLTTHKTKEKNMPNEEVVSEVPSTEEIAQHYSAMLDSVNLINEGQPEGTDDDDWADTVSRNQEHLTLMLAKDFWTTEDMKAVTAAIAV
jgi:hypothetical protein